MRRRKSSGAVEFDLNLAPLVDVVMCLIIFFMLSARLTQREHAERVDLPVSSSAQPAAKRPGVSRVVVNVVPDKSGGAGYVLDDRPVGIAELGARFDREAARDAAVTCYIRADRGIEYRYVEPILVECGRAKIGKVTFATALKPSAEAAP